MKSIYVSIAIGLSALIGCGTDGMNMTPSDLCAGLACAGGAICEAESGACVKKTCDGSGQCIKESCDTSGQNCVKEVCDAMTGFCVNKCLSVRCSANEQCDAASGMCVSKCAGVVCTGGLSCEATSGMCIDKCLGVSCGATDRCDTSSGMCVGKCAGVVCMNDQVCTPTTGSCVDPVPPFLGALIDRVGRPAVNLTLTNPFALYPRGNPESTGATQDRYNVDGTSSMWQTNWSPQLRWHQAIFDGFDTTCGNQLAFDTTTKYATLTGILSQDMLVVDTTRATCAQYLGVELAALGATVNDCGGRGLSYDVIDTMYSLLISGTPSGRTDGVSQTSTPSATFPFLNAPQ